ncbi:hypothetical protein B566_EDAN009911 [Ephemera danica]|nr:hypothetical protein B566_EDAN009911 [Ephemera danica]
MAMDVAKLLQQFSRLSSAVEPSFWHKLCQLKLDVDRLEEPERNVWGHYDDRGKLTLDITAFNSSEVVGAARGLLINRNTIETFRECDKDALLQQQGRALEQAVSSGEALRNPSLVVGRFLLLSFADLKKYHFYYWFAFFAPKSLGVFQAKPASKISDVLTEEQIHQLSQQLDTTCPAFSVSRADGGLLVLPLAQYTPDTILGFYDHQAGVEPGWCLRSLLWLVSRSWPSVQSVDVLCVRRGSAISESSVLHLNLEQNSGPPQWIGWERNERGKLGPRLADLAASMDPVRLAESAVDLNLRLMKWRLLPELELEAISSVRCLLLGAGTLGCGVARGLLAWGVRQITLLDAGRVGFSNPVRQSLFLHRHCLAGGAAKATAAAQSLLDIFPGVVGHTVAQSQRDEVRATCEKLEELIASHDVIFLLTDTRESRWLPTLLAKLHGKLVINAALGFDSFLVMRHGVPAEEATPAVSLGCKNIPGSQLGCYFCNDVVAPRNSTGARTLDQQCTVVRPGVAQVAAALAVELLVSLLQHADRGGAPASTDAEQTSAGSCPLGIIPHSIRGYLAQFQLVLPACHAFPKCAACSATSTGARTLDQQCTVVRPGVAQVAAALAVELLVSLLQHADRGGAPASTDAEQTSAGSCPLGIIPHSIRGYLAQFQLVLPACHAFPKCAACSATESPACHLLRLTQEELENIVQQDHVRGMHEFGAQKHI